MKSALWTRDHNSAYGCVLFGPHIDIKNVNHHSKKIREFPIEGPYFCFFSNFRCSSYFAVCVLSYVNLQDSVVAALLGGVMYSPVYGSVPLAP